MLLYIAITFLSLTLNIFLGLLVYLKNPKGKINRSLALFILTTIGWSLSIFLLRITGNPQLGKLSFFFASLVPLAIISFIQHFPKDRQIFKRALKRTLWLPPAFFAIVSAFDNTLFRGIVIQDNGITTSTGPFFIYFACFFLAYAAISFYTLARKYKGSSGLEKVQIKYLALGILLFAVFATATNLVLPLFGVYRLNAVGPSFSAIMFGFITYAIVKHRFMDIRLVVARSVAYAVMITIFAVLYAMAVIILNSYLLASEKPSLAANLIYVSIAIGIGLSFQPLKRALNKVTDKIFFKDRYDPDTLLNTVSHSLSSTIVLDDLLRQTLKLLAANIKVERATFVLSDNDKNPSTVSLGYDADLIIDSTALKTLSKEKTFVAEELDADSETATALKSLKASVALPLILENKIIGLLLLGEKLSGDIYSKTDLQVLEILTPQIALAIKNAAAYEEIRSFNAKLKDEVKRATAKLRVAYEKLKVIDRTKDDFIYMASHQLRTPVTASKGWLSMILEGDFGQVPLKLKEPIAFLNQNSEHMADLITELLTVSRMNAGTLTLAPQHTDLKQIVGDCINEISVSIKEKGLSLEYVEPEGSIEVFADSKMIREVILNFLTNAVAYTPKGFIKVGLLAENKEVVFKVTDSGIGVPEEAKKDLFGKFVRAENAQHVRPDGNGLGLHLAKYVIERSNGKIIFESEEGAGSVFEFRIPNSTSDFKR